MQKKRIAIIEICIGSLLITFGSIIWCWSKTLLWILIYPPPLAKWIIEISSLVLWGLGILLITDGTRRLLAS